MQILHTFLCTYDYLSSQTGNVSMAPDTLFDCCLEGRHHFTVPQTKQANGGPHPPEHISMC